MTINFVYLAPHQAYTSGETSIAAIIAGYPCSLHVHGDNAVVYVWSEDGAGPTRRQAIKAIKNIKKTREIA